MNRVKYIFAKIRLALAVGRAKAAKDLMNEAVRGTRAQKKEIDQSYEKFLKRCKQQEKAAVLLKRASNSDPGKPYLNVDLGVEHFTVLPNAAEKTTRHDVEVAVTRHRYGDWGEISAQRWRCNNESLKDPYGVIRSCYPLFGGGYLHVETDNRSRETKLYLDGEAS